MKTKVFSHGGLIGRGSRISIMPEGNAHFIPVDSVSGQKLDSLIRHNLIRHYAHFEQKAQEWSDEDGGMHAVGAAIKATNWRDK